MPREPKRAAVTPAFRPFLWLLLVAALFVRAFVPQGYMPERTAESTISVAICGSGGHWAIPLGHDENAPEEKRAEPPCAFAGLGAPALPPAPVPTLSAFPPAETPYFTVSNPVGVIGAGLVLPPARGPPIPA